jgi:exodeoxyribonuclease VII large subunit
MQYVLSVSEINRYIKEVVSKDLILSNLWVKGEISNYKFHYSGHMYFTVKDEASVIKCVMFKTKAQGLKFVPENGLKVLIKGYISVFERDGQYQLYAEEMQPDGLGNLHLAYEQLKKRLSEEGLFDKSKKKKLPLLPKSIGVVTSSTGAVIKDIINVLNRRFYNFDIKILPVAVQGEAAPKQISRAIKTLNMLSNVEVIILARGGGSLEELWAFNEEIVARSIFESEIPVISAVGHETDFTIADFVSDMRAPTPSAAAEMVMPSRDQLEDKIISLNSRLKHSLYNNLKVNRTRYEKLMKSSSFTRPYDRIYQERMRLDVLSKYMNKALSAKKERQISRFNYLLGKLNALSPLTVLKRGYSVTKSLKTDEVIKSVSDVKIEDKIEVDLIDGSLNCVVSSVKYSDGGIYGKNE